MSNKHTFLVSDESVNSYGFRVLTAGIDTAQFERNPIMLYMHDRKHSVIGRWENLRKVKGEMFADAVFDMNDPQAKLIADKVENGFIKSASIGIGITEQTGNLVNSCLLYEISIVDMGSNHNALKLYDPQEIKQLFINLNSEDMSLLQSLTALLGLQTDATETDVLQKIETLTKLEKATEQAKDGQKKELLQKALRAGKITADMLPQYNKMFDLDFAGTEQLLNKIPERMTLADKVKEPGTGESLTGEKSKKDWNLEDYRKFAPKELRDNPKLYQDLLQKENLTNEN